jgi:uncharacterized protein YbjT (DUF2867 family)
VNAKIHPVGLRESITNGLLAAVAGSASLDLAASAADADLVLLDACSYRDLPARLPDLPTVVLSARAVDQAAGSFASEVAAREAAVIGAAGRWCVLRCAPFGEELAFNARYENEGMLYTAWQPEGAPWVSVADVVELIGQLASDPGRWQAAYDLTGPEVVSIDDACAMLHDLRDRPLRYVRIDEDALADVMRQVGCDAVFAARRAGYMVWATSRGCRAPSPLLAQALGRPPTPLTDYLVAAARSSLATAH